ncbi:MAG: hypothetical protein QM722_04370 [Piscinibacter sp.]
MKRSLPWLALVLCACSPALDWREMQAEGSGVVATFPCKPDRHARTVPVAGQALRMEMLVCSAGGATFGLSFVDVSEPTRVSATLIELQRLATTNIAAAEPVGAPLQVPGMTPNPNAVRLRLEGRGPDGTGLSEQAGFFVKGLRVYQATVLGKSLSAELAETFFAGLRLPA